MPKLAVALFIGVIAGLIDVIPMALGRADRYAMASAFTHWVAVGVLVSYVQAPVPHWLKGLLVSVLSTIPVLVAMMKDKPKSVVPILGMSIVLGALVGVVSGRFAK
jgi:hydrogenase/urease accessory protein HupE